MISIYERWDCAKQITIFARNNNLLQLPKMAGIESERKWRFTVLLLEVFMSVCVVVSDTESQIVERVLRRQTGDIYNFIDSGHDTCDQNKRTYLNSENQCVKDEELFKRCINAVVPVWSQQLSIVAVFSSSMPNTYLSSVLTVGDSTTYNNETFKFNRSNQPVNSSLCKISSLEVYRGREQAIEIHHDGFSLSDNGSIDINTDQLGYDLDEYVGELYRMNLSCSGGGLPESGCLFFKAILRRQSNYTDNVVTGAKFNCTVPGTLYDFTKECNITTIAAILNEITSTAMATTSELHIITGTASDSGSEVFYVLAGLGGGILILTFCIVTVIMCIYFGFLLAKRRGIFIVIAVSPHSMYTVDDEQSQQQHEESCQETSLHVHIPSEILANIQHQEGTSSSQDVIRKNPNYINLDPDHCRPVRNPAYMTVTMNSGE